MNVGGVKRVNNLTRSYKTHIWLNRYELAEAYTKENQQNKFKLDEIEQVNVTLKIKKFRTSEGEPSCSSETDDCLFIFRDTEYDTPKCLFLDKLCGAESDSTGALPLLNCPIWSNNKKKETYNV